MYTRLTRLIGLPPERIQATLQHFEEQDLPAVEQMPGYRGLTVGVDEQGGKAFVITLWETREEMLASEKRAAEARDTAVSTLDPDRPPIVDHFEVRLQKEAPAATQQ
ncbi:MAG: antibiotic biosynthesis monooxygenase [Thermoleophilaceae bacterium]